jgi:hypothetical protein
MSLRETIWAIPVIGAIVRRAYRAVRSEDGSAEPDFTNSADYWEQRYKFGGNSGAGSYNRLAEFKADFLNRFVAENGVASVIEFGSGDGAQLMLAEYPSYVGIDVSRTIIDVAKAKFANDPRIEFIHTSEVTTGHKAELSLSLDVIYHLVEDEIFIRYMGHLFDASSEFVIIYSSNEDKAWSRPHVRHRNFTRWVKENRPEFGLIRHVSNPFPYDQDDVANTSFADFFVFQKDVE